MDRMDLDPMGKRKHPDVYDSSPATSPLHPAKRSKVAHASYQRANAPPKPDPDSDTSSNSNGINAAAPGAQQPAHPPKNPEGEPAQSPAVDNAGNGNPDRSGGEDPPLPEPVVRFADLTMDAEARIRAKDAARERERVRLADTRRKRSDTTRGLLDSQDGEGEGGGAEVGAAGADAGERARERGIGRREDEGRPVKKRRKGETWQEPSRDEPEEMLPDKPKEMPGEKPKETPQDKPEEMPREKQQQPVGPQETAPPEKPKDNGVGGAQTDGKPRSPGPRSRKRSSDEALEAEDVAATAPEDALRKRRRKRRRDARTDEM
jgi:hypothetical protein